MNAWDTVRTLRQVNEVGQGIQSFSRERLTYFFGLLSMGSFLMVLAFIVGLPTIVLVRASDIQNTSVIVAAYKASQSDPPVLGPFQRSTGDCYGNVFPGRFYRHCVFLDPQRVR